MTRHAESGHAEAQSSIADTGDHEVVLFPGQYFGRKHEPEVLVLVYHKKLSFYWISKCTLFFKPRKALDTLNQKSFLEDFVNFWR